jgi:GTP cyclohydrolase IB
LTNVQDRRDNRDIPLDRVGITGLMYPISVPDGQGGARTADASVGLFVGLGQEPRGVHMSRLVEALHRGRNTPITREGLKQLLHAMRGDLEAPSAFAEFAYTEYVERRAPVSGAESLLAVSVLIEAALGKEEDEPEIVLTVQAPVLAVCPCSMEATGGEAHSQRGHVSASIRFVGQVLARELVWMMDDSASGPVLPLLKGEDERSIIEEAHERPVFVEDLVRNLAERLDSDVRIYWYRIEAEDLDSVHDHNAYACVERAR